MPDTSAYLFVVDGFADWEGAHAIAELRRHGGYRVESAGLTRDSVVSMGGLRITPSCTVGEIEPTDVAVFILPGGDRWETMPIELELASALKRLDAQAFRSPRSAPLQWRSRALACCVVANTQA